MVPSMLNLPGMFKNIVEIWPFGLAGFIPKSVVFSPSNNKGLRKMYQEWMMIRDYSG